MAAEWTKNVKDITWLRIVAAVFFLVLAAGILTDWEDNAIAFKILIPFTYLYTWANTSIKDISVLIVPLLINLALWIPCYTSYVFLKVVFNIEYIKFLIVLPPLLLILPFSALFQRNNPAPIFFISLITFFIVKNLFSKLKKEEQVKYFKADNISEKRQVWTLRIMLCSLGLIVFSGHILDMYVARDSLVVYTPVQTYELHYPKLNHKEATSKNNSSYIYSEKPISSIADKAKLSPDGKSILVRISSQDDDGKDLFIFETDNFTNTKILQTPKIEQANRTTSGYTFTNDGKYIVVGDEPTKGAKIKFQVLDIATGKRDDRFSDPKELSKLHLSTGIQGVSTIKFSPSGKYFAVVMKAAKIIEIWDYEKKELTCTELLTEKIESFVWLTDEKFLIIHEFYRRNKGYVGRVLECDIKDVSIAKRLRNDISESLLVHLYKTSVSMKSSMNGEYVSIYTSKDTTGQGDNPVDRLSVWNVETAKKLFEVDTIDVIKDTAFYSDSKKILIFTMLYNNKGKISIWDIVTGKKEKELSTSKLSNSKDKQTPYKVKLIDNDRRLMIIGEVVYIISLE